MNPQYQCNTKKSISEQLVTIGAKNVSISHRLKSRLDTDTSTQNFRTTFLANDLHGKFKKSAVASAIAIPFPLCFSCFVPLRRFRENLTKPFYFYPSRTCNYPGGTPSVISLALRACVTRSQCVSLALPGAPLRPSLLHSIVFHILLTSRASNSEFLRDSR